MADMKERFRSDLKNSIVLLQQIHERFNTYMDGLDFCMKMTTYNDHIFAGFGSLGKSKIKPYYCIKLSYYKDGDYITAYLYPLSRQHIYNFYLIPENDPEDPAFGLVTVGYNGSLEFVTCKNLGEVLDTYGIFIDIKK